MKTLQITLIALLSVTLLSSGIVYADPEIIAQLEAKIAELEAKIVELKEDKQKKNAQIDELRDKLKTKTKQIDNLNDRLDNQKAKFETKLDKKDVKIDKLENKIVKLEDIIDRKNSKIDRKDTNIDNKKEKLAIMQSQLDSKSELRPVVDPYPEPTQPIQINASNSQSQYDQWQNIISQPPFWIYNSTQLLESGSNVFTLSGVSIGSGANSTTFTTYVFYESNDDPIYTSQTVSDDSGEFLVKVLIDPTWQDGDYTILITLDNNITVIGAHGYIFNTEIQDGVFMTDEFYVYCGVQNALGDRISFLCYEDAVG